MTAIFDALDTFPTAGLMRRPTPLDPLSRLGDHLGLELWIKRDDLTTLAGGGNKIRQLDYYFGAAQQSKADTVLITGAVQSNYVRAAAGVAAKLGMQAVLQLENRVSGMDDLYASSGNVFLSEVLGARHITYPTGEDEAGADAALQKAAAELRERGRVPYVIPLGLGNKPLGALGYISAAKEIVAQDPNFDAIVVASGSGATHAGLLYGLRAVGSTTKVFGSCVRRAANEQTVRLTTITEKISTLLNVESAVTPQDILTWDGALAPGYGLPSAKMHAALRLMATMEGLFLDPVYTAKGFAAVAGLLSEGRLERGMRVLFIHTGGVPALFGYQTALSDQPFGDIAR